MAGGKGGEHNHFACRKSLAFRSDNFAQSVIFTPEFKI